MDVVETKEHGQVLVVRMNRPERLNALNHEMRTRSPRRDRIPPQRPVRGRDFTGTGRGFCAGEDMKESLAAGTPGGRRPTIPDPFMTGALEKPVIAAVNGFAMGGGFMLVERTDLRVAVKGAVFEVSEAKRWLLGGYNHGTSPPALSDRDGDGAGVSLHRRAVLRNRLSEPARRARPAAASALAMAEHLLTLRRPRGSTPST